VEKRKRKGDTKVAVLLPAKKFGVTSFEVLPLGEIKRKKT